MSKDIWKEIEETEKKLESLPLGYVTKKNVGDREYYYRRVKSGSKYVEIPIETDAVEMTKSQIAIRKQLERRLKELYAVTDGRADATKRREGKPEYNMNIMTGDELAAKTERFKTLKRRDCFSAMKEFIYGDSYGKVFILYGLRRTGKSTLMCQIVADMDDEHFAEAAYINTKRGDGLAALNKDMNTLFRQGFRYVFIDEVTFMGDFIEGASLLSDVFAEYGMKIVLSGTDSLGFAFAEDSQLYDRCYMAHTTFIPYREFENVLGIKGIDEYIKYGGTMSPSGVLYNEEDTFKNGNPPVNRYVNTAIAENIQNSLKNYQYEGHFRALEELYRKKELTNAINRVVEDMNHSFAVDVITREFKSNDLASNANILRKENNVLDRIDTVAFHGTLRKALDILNLSEQTVPVSEIEVSEIKEYLEMLDLVYEIDLLSGDDARKINIISQPGLRYAQAEAFIESLLADKTFAEMTTASKDFVQNRILSEISGRMMEEIVLLETRLFGRNKKIRVFKLQFKDGEFDMVVEDRTTYTCKIYEIKHSDKRVPDQYRHLMNEDKCANTEVRFGKITGKYVIYRGETCDEGPIHYLNVEEYLKSL